MSTLFWCTVISVLGLGICGPINLDAGPDIHVRIGETAVIKCIWTYGDGVVVTAGDSEVLSWGASAGKVCKVTKGNPNETYVYLSSPVEEDRASCGGDFSADARIANLSIQSYQATDPDQFTCDVEANHAQQADIVKVIPFAEPTLTMFDVVVSADIRTSTVEVEAETNDTFANSTSDDDNEEAQKITVSVEIVGAYPEPEIEFIIGDSERRTATATFYQDDRKLFNGNATLELEPDKALDGKKISAIAILPMLEEPVSSVNTSSAIEILHDVDDLRISIEPSTAAEGTEVQITCTSEGNPQPTYQVYPDHNVVKRNANQFYIAAVMQEDASAYYCRAVVPDGNGGEMELNSNSEQLEVHFLRSPTTDADSQTLSLAKGDDLLIECNGAGNPNPQQRWTKSGRDVGSGSTLDITDLTYADEGTYTCESWSQSEFITETKTVSMEVTVRGACQAKCQDPEVSSSSSEDFQYRVELTCTVTGNPPCEGSIVPHPTFTEKSTFTKDGDVWTLLYQSIEQLSAPVSFFCVAGNSEGPKVNKTIRLDEKAGTVCCAEVSQGGLSTGAVIGIILLVLVVLIGIPVACYFVKKRKAQPKKKAPADPEAPESEKEGLNKEASSEDSDTGSLPPPPADMEQDHRLNSAHEMTTFSTNK